MAVLLVGEKCSRTTRTLRFFASSCLALKQDPKFFKRLIEKKDGKIMTHKDSSSGSSCFGSLDIVFPVEGSGFRKIADSCFSCTHLKACLQKAMQGEEGLRFNEERIDRAYRHGLIGAFRRWSEKKHIKRKIEELKRK